MNSIAGIGGGEKPGRVGEARLTKYRRDVEAELAEELGSLTKTA